MFDATSLVTLGVNSDMLEYINFTSDSERRLHYDRSRLTAENYYDELKGNLTSQHAADAYYLLCFSLCSM